MTVAYVTGNGLKTQEAVVDAVGRPVRILPSLVAFERTFRMGKNGGGDTMIKVRIPTPLRPLTKGQGEVEVTAGTIVDMIETLDTAHPGIKARLCDDSGEPVPVCEYLCQ